MTQDATDVILQSLERLHQRLDRMEQRLSTLEDSARQVPAVIATVTDAADGLAGRLGEGALLGRMEQSLHLLEQASRPENLALLQALLDRSDRIQQALELIEQAPGTVAMLADTFDSLSERIASTGIPLHTRIEVLVDAAERLSSPDALAVLKVVTERLTEIRSLLQGGVLDPEALRIISLAGHALVASRACDCGPVGALGALSAVREPEIQRSLGFAVAFARQFGQALNQPPAPV